MKTLFTYRCAIHPRPEGRGIFAVSDKEYWYNGKYFDCKTTEEFLRLIKLEIF